MLLDTSGLLCFHHRSESQRGEAVMFVDARSLGIRVLATGKCGLSCASKLEW